MIDPIAGRVCGERWPYFRMLSVDDIQGSPSSFGKSGIRNGLEGVSNRRTPSNLTGLSLSRRLP